MIALAWSALWLWPMISIVLFRQLRLPMAVCVSLIGGYLLLPNGISYDLPLLPPLDKFSIPTFTTLLLTMVALARPEQAASGPPGWLPQSRVAQIMFATQAVHRTCPAQFWPHHWS